MHKSLAQNALEESRVKRLMQPRASWRSSSGTFDEDYTWNRPALLLRKLELKAGHPSRRGGRQKGSAAAYSNKLVGDSERETIANTEDESHFVATWKPQSPKGR